MGEPVRRFSWSPSTARPRRAHSVQAGFESLHAEFVERLPAVPDRLLTASAASHTRGDTRAYDFILGMPATYALDSKPYPTTEHTT